MNSHRGRLALISAGITAFILAGIFGSIILAVNRFAYIDERGELTQIEKSAPIRDGVIDISAVQQAHPAYLVAKFDLKGGFLDGDIRARNLWQEGTNTQGDWITYCFFSHGEGILVAANWNDADMGSARLARALAILWLPVSALAGLASWYSTSSIFLPMRALANRAAKISGSDLAERLPDTGQAELKELADQLNRMLDRIQAASVREVRFLEDAAHDLRTPMALLKTRIQTALLKERKPGEYQDTLHSLLAEVDRTIRLSEALLQSARADIEYSGPPLDLATGIEVAVARWRERFAAAGQEILAQIMEATAAMPTEELDILLDNLLSNALKFSSEGEKTVVSLFKDGPRTCLVVQDEGPGVPSEERDKAFDRLYRAESSRNRQTDGAGIGLSVCRRIVEARGGRISIEPSAKGARFVVSFPQA